jgi:hypothetical protein
MLCALKRKYKLFNIHICICCGRAFVRPFIFMGGLLSALSFLREGFFHLVIFTRGLLSALSFFDGRAFLWEGFCPGGLLSYTHIEAIDIMRLYVAHAIVFITYWSRLHQELNCQKLVYKCNMLGPFFLC